MRIVSLPFSYGTLHSHSILTSQCSDRMGCDSMHLQDHQNLQRDGILKQEISSPSNIMDIYLPPRNPNSPPSIDCDLICNGMMLFIIGRNRNPSLKVSSPSILILLIISSIHPLLIFSFWKLVGSIQSSRRNKPKGFWLDVENRREFFSAFAQSNGFDPLDFQRWKQFSRAAVAKHQV